MNTTAPMMTASAPDAQQQQTAPQPQMPQSAAATPPTFESGNPGLDNLIKIILSSQQRKSLPQPVPRPTQVGQSEMNIPGNPGSAGHEWGTAIAGIGKAVSGAATQFRQAQLAKAESEWNQLNTLMQDQSPQGQQKTQAWLISNQKALKGMAKALNQDWLNPEKTTVYKQALDSTLKQQQAKGQAKQGIMNLFKQLIGKANQPRPQLDPSQQQGMAQEIMGKAPVSSTQDPKEALDMARGVLDIEKASAELRQKYQFITSTDGKVWAVNKNDPRDAMQVKDKASGDAITGQTKTSSAPAVQSLQGVPFGIKRGGKLVTPDMDDWSADDQKIFDAAKGAAERKQQLRIDPVIADQLGEPPDPSKYQGGKASTSYGKALRDYGQQAEAIKNRMAGAQGAARAMAFNEYRPLQIYNPDTGDIEWTYAKNAIGLTPGGAAEKLLPKSAQIKDINFASQKMRSAVQNIDRPFSPEQVAKLNLALSTPDDKMAKEIVATLATQNLTPAQQDFVIWAGHLNERAMSVRNIAGMGQGAQDVRNAIKNTLPGVQSGSKEMQLKQLDAFDNMVGILRKGIAGVKGDRSGGDSSGFIYARDPSGKLQKAPAGTTLPKGWKQEQAPQ